MNMNSPHTGCETTTLSAHVTGRHHTTKTLHPDVQYSTVRHENQSDMSFPKEQQVLAQELAVQMKMQKDGACPNRMDIFIPIGQPRKTRPSGTL